MNLINEEGWSFSHITYTSLTAHLQDIFMWLQAVRPKFYLREKDLADGLAYQISPTDNPITITITGDHAITAQFVEDVDTDGDGVPDGQDLCPGTPSGEPVYANGCSAAQADTDLDGYEGSLGSGEDCNDSNPAINPGATEVCDGVDNNCDGQIDEGCASQYSLLMSTSPNRTGAVSLDGQTVSGDIYVFTGPDAGVKRVSFYVDGVFHRSEGIVPFDYDGTDLGGLARPTHTTWYSDTSHQITAVIELTNGSTEPPITAVFTVDNGGAPVDTDGDGVLDGQDLCPGTIDFATVDANGCSDAQRDADSDGYEGSLGSGEDCNDSNPAIHPGAAEVCDGVDNNCDGQIDEGCASQYSLLMSTSPNRTGAVSLDGQTVSGDIYVFTGPDAGVKRVSFYVDGVFHRSEGIVPFDYDGTDLGGLARPTHTTWYSDTSHQITAVIELTDGSTEPPITAVFTVDNGGAPVDTDGDGVLDGQDLCPGTIDFATVDANGCSDAQRDADSDGYEGSLGSGEDCNDSNPAIHPGATEVCDGVDNNCDGQIDEGCASQYSLLMSTSPNRTGAVSLDGQTVSGDIYVFTGPDAGVKRVSFYVDGVFRRSEGIVPFDYDGTDWGDWRARRIPPGTVTPATR